MNSNTERETAVSTAKKGAIAAAVVILGVFFLGTVGITWAMFARTAMDPNFSGVIIGEFPFLTSSEVVCTKEGTQSYFILGHVNGWKIMESVCDGEFHTTRTVIRF